MSQPIIFYDIPSTAKGVAWSPNTWKTRYTLNIKGIPYTTVWVEYPDIAALCQKIGAGPTAKKGDGSPLYTLPAIFDPNTQTALADSAKIARYLEATYPNAAPRLIPAELDVFIAAFQDAFWGALGTGYAPVIIPAAFDVLCEGSKPYFRQTREARLGGKLEELAPPGSEARGQVWAHLKKATGKIAAWYEGAAGGKERIFVLGDGASVTYADVVVAGFFVWFKVCLGEESEEWKEMASWNGGRWGKLLAALEKYSAVDVGEQARL
ncbi:hypothetical protein GSI_15318 [Ganoderma sinense ZZ0214-1]|uniref:GST N-terminal domain-containing protein n=1 Tax=Ganoderma sinense ZZ0214-1 TaxID=1077348 RepID=A0A2G8RM83_9APHY|nr:hypothetical protein GSI_15318 [Ganoderma sinense ZZ0214-1]